jgi:hypothetical protein
MRYKNLMGDLLMDADKDNMNHRLVGKYVKGVEKSEKKKKGAELPKVNFCSGKLTRHQGCQ